MSTNVMATNSSRTVPNPDSSPLPGVADQGRTQIRLWALAATLLALCLAYAPNFMYLSLVWLENVNYSHGWLVIPIALVIVWQRLSALKSEPVSSAIRTSWFGWGSLGVVLAVRAFAYEKGSQWAETATILPAIVCLVWIFGGWPFLKRVRPAIAFLVFMLPQPPLINEIIALPLQQIAATGSCFLLQFSGLWAIQEGNTIDLTTSHGVKERLDVALACNGLSMLMTLAATMTATIIVISLPTWKRIILLISVVPIALMTNMARIVATGWCYYLIEGPSAKAWAHDVSGWMMMPLALALVGLELAILAWLVPVDNEPVEDDRKSMLILLNEKNRGITSSPGIVPKKGRDPEV